MTQDEIIEMARQAGFTVGYGSPALPKHEAFAKLVAQKAKEQEYADLIRIIEANILEEREACANICWWLAAEFDVDSKAAIRCADAIRARGEA